ncbi:hypothetical protein LGM71_01110 [Burkholderia sp. AU33545]|uniref:hypothetical protein n=1 Tax=Burkholderia sp. AU33545 TaxID=2879631 RepID=UPI001CF331CF|nr:hypothetical protein [Burkholderia sp. AU33545]MCA8199654.1 hypothetical protein [Burkholderia sp. AU33545]
MNDTPNCYHSPDGIQLSDAGVRFSLDIAGVQRFSICMDLACGPQIATNCALIQFEFSEPPDEPERLGLVHSHHGWWYRYVPTRAGRVSVDWEFVQATPFTGIVRFKLVTWGAGDVVRLRSFVALKSPLAEQLAARYENARDAARYPPKVWASISEFLSATTLQNCAHIIPVNDLLIEFLLVDRRSPALFCFLHGNAPRSDVFKLPVFSGVSMMNDVNSSVLIFSDPALLLDPDLTLAWHVGTSTTPLQYLYELVTEKVRSVLAPERLVFWGGSGGGFASLYLSTRFADSTAFVWNPQTSILAFEEMAVRNFGRVCFGTEDLGTLRERLEKVAVADLWRVYPSDRNRVVYLQNFTDWHTESHLKPFLSNSNFRDVRGTEFWGWLEDRLFLHLGSLAQGHEPPPKEAINAFLVRLAHSGPDAIESVRVLPGRSADHVGAAHDARVKEEGPQA